MHPQVVFSRLCMVARFVNKGTQWGYTSRVQVVAGWLCLCLRALWVFVLPWTFWATVLKLSDQLTTTFIKMFCCVSMKHCTARKRFEVFVETSVPCATCIICCVSKCWLHHGGLLCPVCTPEGVTVGTKSPHLNGFQRRTTRMPAQIAFFLFGGRPLVKMRGCLAL